MRGPASRVPEFARPQRLTGDEDFLTDDLIPYRRLSRDDFRAPRPPPNFGDDAAQMGAITCAAIKSRPGARFIWAIAPMALLHGAPRIHGTPPRIPTKGPFR